MADYEEWDTAGQAERTWRRNPRVTDWDLYRERLAMNAEDSPRTRGYRDQRELDEANDKMVKMVRK